jgi:hypothetical protein
MMASHKGERMSFKVTSGKLVICDPCYSRSTLLQMYGNKCIVPAVNGEWKVKVYKDFNGNVESVEAFTVKSSGPSELRDADFKVDVDSGQAGIFDEAFYPQDNERGDDDYDDPQTFYGECCALTLSDDGYGHLVDGFVSSSGFGDGEYSCSLNWNEEGNVDAVIITFLEDEVQDEDGEDFNPFQ